MSVAASSYTNIVPLSISRVDTPIENGPLYYSVYVFCDNCVPDSFVYYDTKYGQVMMHDYRNLMETLRGQFGWTSKRNWFYESSIIEYDNKNLYALGFHFSKEADAIAFKFSYT